MLQTFPRYMLTSWSDSEKWSVSKTFGNVFLQLLFFQEEIDFEVVEDH